jgi:hypothetical protein
MKMLVGWTALAICIASPAFAQGRPDYVSGARAAAIHQCSAVAAQYKEYTWGDMEIQQYRACMAVHGQVE